MGPIVILKFGSSVLKDRAALPEVVTEIYRVVRSGRRVVAVTSAFDGVTDGLIGEGMAFGCPHDNVNAPAFIATGEELSAALVAMACDRAGLCAIGLKAPELGILAAGAPEDATPIALPSPHLEQCLEHYDVVVVPGFVASDARGRTVLLGRGGSDLTAVFLAHALKAERVRLVKDVDGVYDSDPACSEGSRRFSRITWSEARAVAGALVQRRALDFAEEKRVAIEVGAIGRDDVTSISSSANAPVPPRPRRKLRVALAGYGVVGAGVARRLFDRSDVFEITGVLVRDGERTREGGLNPGLFVTAAADLLDGGPDVVVDALSCARTGAALSEAALARGIDVVSANKQAVAQRFDALHDAAHEGGAALLYSASVGGGAPLLEAAARAKAAGEAISGVAGVLNGTVNFILERLGAGATFEQAIAEAQRAGLAEADPSADLDGRDAAAKLHLIALALFGRAPSSWAVETLDAKVALRAADERMKQVARLERFGDELRGRVSFEPAGAFAGLHGDRNAIEVVGESGRVWSARGRGAGRWPTTESVFADLVDLSAAPADVAPLGVAAAAS